MTRLPAYFDMSTLPTFSTKALFALLVFCGAANAMTEEAWPTAPQLMELPTPYGTLEISESDYIYESRLKIDGEELDPPVKGRLYISFAFELPDRQAALVAISQGNDICPVSYRWVVVRANGREVSPAFGSCSERIRVSADAKHLTLHTPNRESPEKIDEYVYDGKTIKQRTRNTK